MMKGLLTTIYYYWYGIGFLVVLFLGVIPVLLLYPIWLIQNKKKEAPAISGQTQLDEYIKIHRRAELNARKSV